MSLKVNGKAYDWGDVDVKIPGMTLIVQEISYDDELEKEVVYGKGPRPRGYGTGNYKASGKISMLKDDYDELIEYCKTNGIPLYRLEIPKIIVSYANEGQATVSDVLNKVSISKASHKAAQSDKSMKVDLDLMIAGTIERNGVQPV